MCGRPAKRKKNFRIGAARGQGLTCVRPHMGICESTFFNHVICRSPASFSDLRSKPLHDLARSRSSSTSHSVAAQVGRTTIPLAAERAQEDATLLCYGV